MWEGEWKGPAPRRPSLPGWAPPATSTAASPRPQAFRREFVFFFRRKQNSNKLELEFKALNQQVIRNGSGSGAPQRKVMTVHPPCAAPGAIPRASQPHCLCADKMPPCAWKVLANVGEGENALQEVSPQRPCCAAHPSLGARVSTDARAPRIFQVAPGRACSPPGHPASGP